ncbi:hypothetical protein DFH07DRAFT_319294 [Mycena maculata]|uniref:Uncharacterized protein n=1 Tax=Mycena maculata TaxID=230809 RepID=A0AAD7P047_9AGAR|nr:hypothetical protein DFH07DRAFT_319294 [Mycena maculata]
MYFHNVATHRHPRISSAAKLSWEPFHMQSFFRTPSPELKVDPRRYLQELREGSEALPRHPTPRGRADIVYFQLPGGGGANIQYVPSWPPSIPASASPPSSASSASSIFSSQSVYHTPPTTPAVTDSPTTDTTSTIFTPQTDHSLTILSPSDESKIGLPASDLSDAENRPPVQATFQRVKQLPCLPADHRRRIPQPRESTGLKGWARLRRNAPPALRIEQEAASGKHHYILEFGDEDGLVKPQSQLALLRRENSLEHRSLLLALLMNGSS